jgi:hypothetical protein
MRGRWSTDQDGHFELVRIPRRGMHLSVSGEGILPTSFELDSSVDPSAVVIEVAVRCHVQFVLVDPEGDVKSIRVLGADGEVIQAQVFSGGSRWSYQTVELTEGRSPVLALPDTAASVLLFGHDGREVRRVPIRLAPGEPSTVQL